MYIYIYIYYYIYIYRERDRYVCMSMYVYIYIYMYICICFTNPSGPMPQTSAWPTRVQGPLASEESCPLSIRDIRLGA